MGRTSAARVISTIRASKGGKHRGMLSKQRHCPSLLVRAPIPDDAVLCLTNGRVLQVFRAPPPRHYGASSVATVNLQNDLRAVAALCAAALSTAELWNGRAWYVPSKILLIAYKGWLVVVTPVVQIPVVTLTMSRILCLRKCISALRASLSLGSPD